MRETDHHFSAAQLEALHSRGIPLTTAPWRRVKMAVLRSLSITDPGHVTGHAERDPMCPILDSNARGDLVILPDGSETWVPHA